MLEIIAQVGAEAPTVTAAVQAGITGSVTSGLGCLGGALGVGLIGLKACESVGRNPGASGQILVQSILGMALAEGVAILSLVL